MSDAWRMDPKDAAIMDIEHVASLVRSLTERPSRRAVARGLLGIAVASSRAPFLGFADVEGRRRGRKRKKRERNKKKPDRCPAQTLFCDEGDFSECCNTATNPESGNPFEFCVGNCGCCDYGFSKCCPGRDEALCCKNDDICCTGPNFEVKCCTTDQTCCGGGCCNEKDAVCCQKPNGEFYCCTKGLTCCSTGGNQCCA